MQQVLALQSQNVAGAQPTGSHLPSPRAVAKAKAEIAARLRRPFPRPRRRFNLAALAQLAEHQPAAARASYERALQIDAGNLEALDGIFGYGPLSRTTPRMRFLAVEAALARQNRRALSC